MGSGNNERHTLEAVTGDLAEDCRSLFDIIRAHLTLLHGKLPVKQVASRWGATAPWVVDGVAPGAMSRWGASPAILL